MKIFYLYKIVNTKNNKIYIGQTVQPEKRWYQHKYESAKAKPSTTIAYSIKKYGNDVFEFEVIACCLKQEDANETETLLVKQYKSHVSTGRGYNVSLGGRSTPISDETKHKMSIVKMGKKLSVQHVQNISKALKGKAAHNKGNSILDETKKKISTSMQGIIFSEEHRSNLSKANYGKKKSEETKQKMRKPKSDEHKKKMSEARKRYLENKLKERSTIGN